FFQAEDGIRDLTVTGVQTCALPIFDGRADLEAKIVRAVGDPAERFAEDALRMLRAIRFASVLRMRIEPATADAIQANAKLAGARSEERRVGKECSGRWSA